MICICDYCSIEKDIRELVEIKIKKEKKRLCLKCWVKYKLENESAALSIKKIQTSEPKTMIYN